MNSKGLETNDLTNPIPLFIKCEEIIITAKKRNLN